MAKKIILTTLLFIFLLCIFMIVNLPANFVYKHLIETQAKRYPIQVQTPQGTIWSGHSGIATKTDIPITFHIPHIRWSFQYQQIMALKFVYKIEFTSIEAVGKKLGNYYAFVGADFNGLILQIQDDNALLSLKAVGQFNTNPATIAGKIELRRQDPELQNLLNTIPQIRQDGSFRIPVNTN